MISKVTNTLTPSAVEIIDIYDDGLDSRHFTFKATVPINTKIAPGQFFMLSIPGAGEAPFTYVSLPDDNGHFTALIRKAGTLTKAAFKLKTGDVIGYRGPLGIGWPLEVLASERCLIVAGGCGLAPLSAIIDYIIDNPTITKTCLIYGSRTEAHQVLNQERKRWQQSLNIIEAIDITENPATRGNVCNFTEHAEDMLGGLPTVLFCCGPDKMMDVVYQQYRNKGIAAQNIWISVERRMHCGVGTCGHCYIGSSYACKDGPTYRYDTLVHHLNENHNMQTQEQSLDERITLHC